MFLYLYAVASLTVCVQVRTNAPCVVVCARSKAAESQLAHGYLLSQQGYLSLRET